MPMKIMNVSLLLFLVGGSVQAASWPALDYVGRCVGEETAEGQVTIKFYSEKMKPDQAARGFAAVSIKQGAKTEEFGAYNAIYTLFSDESKMTVQMGSESIEVPFGKNKQVVDSDGKQMICSTKI